MKINLITTNNKTETQKKITFQAVNKFFGAEKDLAAIEQHLESITPVRKLIKHKNNYTQFTLSNFSFNTQPQFLNNLVIIDYKKPQKGKASEKVKIILSEQEANVLSEDVTTLRSMSSSFIGNASAKVKKEIKKQAVQRFWQGINSFINENLKTNEHCFNAEKSIAEMQEGTFDYHQLI